jgi:signal transduction histidine kinase
LQLSMEQRRNFYLIFKEAVNNLVKYSGCTLATVSLLVEFPKLTLTIEDDGIGFDPTKLRNRNGIVNMKARAVKLHGSLDIQSEVGKGTMLKLEFNADRFR